MQILNRARGDGTLKFLRVYISIVAEREMEGEVEGKILNFPHFPHQNERERVLRVSIKVSSRLCLTSCFLSSLQLWTDEVVNPHCVRSVLICAGLENYRMKANKQTVNRWKYKQRETEKYSRDITQLTAEIEWNWNPRYLLSRFGFSMQRPTSCEWKISSSHFIPSIFHHHMFGNEFVVVVVGDNMRSWELSTIRVWGGERAHTMNVRQICRWKIYYNVILNLMQQQNSTHSRV